MIIRAIALKDATVTGLAVSTCAAGGTAYDLGSNESAQIVFAALHVLSTGTAGSQNNVLVTVLSNSSSGFSTAAPNAGTVQFTFTAVACRFAQWGTPVATIFATCQRFWRMEWVTTCAGKNALVYMSRTCSLS